MVYLWSLQAAQEPIVPTASLNISKACFTPVLPKVNSFVL